MACLAPPHYDVSRRCHRVLRRGGHQRTGCAAVGRQKLTFQDANEAELDDLGHWQTLAGAQANSDLSEDLAEARRSGLLGAALRGGVDHAMTIRRYPTMFHSLCARTLAMSARSRGRTSAMIMIGPNPRMLQPGPEFNGFNIAVLLNVAKLHVVAVDPEYQGVGIGSRLIKIGSEIARQSGYRALYGEFDSTRAHLAGFYQRRGFQVLALGERLDLSDVMGTQTLVGAAERTDQLGVMALT